MVTDLFIINGVKGKAEPYWQFDLFAHILDTMYDNSDDANEYVSA